MMALDVVVLQIPDLEASLAQLAGTHALFTQHVDRTTSRRTAETPLESLLTEAEMQEHTDSRMRMNSTRIKAANSLRRCLAEHEKSILDVRRDVAVLLSLRRTCLEHLRAVNSDIEAVTMVSASLGLWHDNRAKVLAAAYSSDQRFQGNMFARLHQRIRVLEHQLAMRGVAPPTESCIARGVSDDMRRETEKIAAEGIAGLSSARSRLVDVETQLAAVRVSQEQKGLEAEEARQRSAQLERELRDAHVRVEQMTQATAAMDQSLNLLRTTQASSADASSKQADALRLTEDQRELLRVQRQELEKCNAVLQRDADEARQRAIALQGEEDALRTDRDELGVQLEDHRARVELLSSLLVKAQERGDSAEQAAIRAHGALVDILQVAHPAGAQGVDFDDMTLASPVPTLALKYVRELFGEAGHVTLLRDQQAERATRAETAAHRAETRARELEGDLARVRAQLQQSMAMNERLRSSAAPAGGPVVAGARPAVPAAVVPVPTRPAADGRPPSAQPAQPAPAQAAANPPSAQAPGPVAAASVEAAGERSAAEVDVLLRQLKAMGFDLNERTYVCVSCMGVSWMGSPASSVCV